MTEDPTDGETRARNQALSLLERAHGIRAEVEQARSSASSSGRAQLSKIIASLSSAEVQLAQAVDAPSGQPIDLSSIEAVLGSSEQETDAAIQQSSADVTAANARTGAAATFAATRTEVQGLSHDLFEQKIFDRYLHFGSAEDEQEYREHEAARQHAITQQLALHTPTGDLNAGGLEAGQMLDAGAHGATASPDFMPRWNKLVEQLHQERAALQAAHQPTATFDRQIRSDIRAALQKQGVPEEQIERVLASDDPLKAVTPYLASDRSHALEKALGGEATPTDPQGPSAASKTPAAAMPAPTSTGMAGMQVDTDFASSDSPQPTAEGHGLPQQARNPAVRPTGRTVG